MNQKPDLSDSSQAVIPISKAVIRAFSKADYIAYATHDNGSIYISNGYFIMKTGQAEFDGLLEQVNKRRRTEKLSPVESPSLLLHVSGDKGKFELSGEPLEFELSDKRFISLFSDEKQYFGYNKSYVDIFRGGDNRLFVDDNASYDTYNHNMIIKSSGEVLGVVLPLRLTDEFYAEMADVLPLKVKWKTELERIKENPTNDPYIGKEYFDGRDTYIVSALREVGGADVYIVPNLADGKISRYADHVKPDDMESKIMEWETKRIDREHRDKANNRQTPPAQKETPPAPEESKGPARPFTHLRRSPWGEVQACDKLCPGVFMVSAAEQGGVMVTRDMTAAFSPAAMKRGVKFNDFVCFGENGAKDVALRELLDKKLWVVPGKAKDRADFEESINKSLREHSPDYWRSRQKGLEQAQRRHNAPARNNNAPAHDTR